MGDYDGDGDPDFLVSVADGTPVLLRNDALRASAPGATSRAGSDGAAPARHWLILKPIGVRSNRDGIGTRFVVHSGGVRQIGWVRSGCSYASQNDLRAYFGLGAATRVDAVNDDAPAVQVVQLIITQALRDRASDVHIEPHAGRVRVRYRIDGALHQVLDLPGSVGPVVMSRIKVLAGMNIVERRRPQDGQMSMDVEGRAVDIRVSTTAVIGGEKVVLRLLDKSRPLYRLAQLGMPADMSARYSAMLRSPYGMVICAGPTGSGMPSIVPSL